MRLRPGRGAALALALALAGPLSGPSASAVAAGPVYSLVPNPYMLVGTDLSGVTVSLYESGGVPEPEGSTARVYLNGVDIGPMTLSYPGNGKSGSTTLHATGVCGTNTVTVGSLRQPLASTRLTVLCPTLGVKPGVVYPGDLPSWFFLTVQGFDSGEGSSRVQILLDGVAQQVTSGDALAFRAAPSCGPHQVRAVQQIAAGPVTADSTITVRCGRIVLDPATVAKSAEPTGTVVSGQEFPPNVRVRLAIDGAAGPAAATDGQGGFTAKLPVAGLDCGPHQVTATADGAIPTTATAQLTVDGCPPAAGASLTVDPDVLVPGLLTHATGQGFAPGQQLVLSWQTPDGGALIGETEVTAGPDGSVDAWCMAMPHDLVGARKLVATASTAPGTVLTSADLVVDTAGMEPTAGSHLVFRR
ncbi:hypothetical protein AB0K51_01225 [Kitasatospora sp. NPDC049285]|uniref:hypothetical protein n=1 Tax=Kitasatospora sp. NPDC049285 TaxID=3157096 RepID=UPI00343AD5A3